MARRSDGQVVQLTPVLYAVLAAIDGRRGYEEIAEVVSTEIGKHVTAENVQTLVESKLCHTGLLTEADGSQPRVEKSQPLLGLRFKYAVTDPERTRRLTQPFTVLFNPLLVVVVLAAFFVLTWWVLLEKGLASATHEAFNKPGLLLIVIAVTVLSAGFHEFGHAAAARRGGATPGVMGAGLYLVWPAFYTDVTDSYRLGRGGRLRTDLGGLYFNAIVALVTVGVWRATGYDAVLLVVATQILQMIRQLTPLVRFDGYHVLADLTGVPDLFHHIKPTLLGLLPWKWGSPESKILKPWARAVVTLWVTLVVPLLAFALFTMVVAFPRLVGTAWAGLGKQRALMSAAFGDGDPIEVVARFFAMFALVLPLLAIAIIVGRLIRQVARSAWNRTDGRPVRRAGTALLAVALTAGLVHTWWPDPETYRPIMAYERGTLADVAADGSQGRLSTAWDDDTPRPTRERPQLAVILVPRDGDTGNQSWVFPFNQPLKPGKGDNQAMAVNTTDGTVQYDVAFALVWVTDDSPALQKNESYALASCTSCAAVSVAFQVVLVTGDNHIAAPQNIAAAVNYNCASCLTYALATPLFVTLDGPLSESGTEEIARLWQEIAAYWSRITDVPLSEIQDRLNDFERRILAVIEKEQGDPATPSATPTPTESASPTPTATATSGGPTPDRTATPSPSPDLPGAPEGPSHAEVVQTEYGHVPRSIEALRGIDTVFMVSLHDGVDHTIDHHDFVDAAAQAGVRQMVYLSIVGAGQEATSFLGRQHGDTENYLTTSGLENTIIRANFVAETLPGFLTEDVLYAPVADGRVAAVARDDVAASIATVLSDAPPHAGKIYELSGPQALDFHDIAAAFTTAFGEKFRFIDWSEDEARLKLADHQAPEHVVDEWLSVYRAIRQGVHREVTDDVRHLTGREPTPVAEALSRLQD